MLPGYVQYPWAHCQLLLFLLVQVLHKATTLHFEFSSSPAGTSGTPGEAGRAATTIHVPNLDSFTESEHQILAELVRRYKVPQTQR